MPICNCLLHNNWILSRKQHEKKSQWFSIRIPFGLGFIDFPGIEMVQQRAELQTPYGQVEVIALRSGDGPRSTVLVNVGCYYTLADAGARVYI